MSKYLWCEDRGSGYQFWCNICGYLYPDITVESKINNSRLRIAVDQIRDDGNEYYILIDAAADNPDVLREIKALKKNAAGKDNVHIIPIHSFEFALLSFRRLEKWIFAEQDELREKRKGYLHIRALFLKLILSEGSSEELSEFRELFPYAKKANTEQIASKLLFEITRNTGFETDKGNIGVCFTVDCCDWSKRQANDICGLDNNKISASKKAELLVSHSILKRAFERVGLYDNGL